MSARSRRRVSQSKAARWTIQRFMMDLMPFGRYDPAAHFEAQMVAVGVIKTRVYESKEGKVTDEHQ